MKKTNCPHSLLYCTPNPCVCFLSLATVGENLAEQRQRDTRSQVPSAQDARPQQPGTQTQPLSGSCQGRGTGGGRARKLMTPRVPSNCNGHRKGDLINTLDELCITSACRLPASKLYYSYGLYPITSLLALPCPESCCPTSIS